jgi:S-methylmethionine-dependent homocysteine/selenocysteine methylase
VDLALEAAQGAGRPVAVAGVLGSLEEPVGAERALSPRVLADEHGEQAVRLHAAGCHLVLVDAMPSLRETLAATAAARAAMPAVWTTLSLQNRTLLADGSALAEAATLAVAVGAQALLLEAASMADLAAAVGSVTALALGVPVGVRGVDETPEADGLARALAPALEGGARILGGARGTTPEQIHALVRRVRARVAA